MISFLSKYIYNIGFDSIVKIRKNFQVINEELTKHKVRKVSFGNKNKEINFYVIKRSPGAGFFSNLLYVISQLQYANKKGMVPIVDMQNFPTYYNQKKNIKDIKNIWELYFNQVSDYSLEEVYQSKNVYFSPSRYNFFFEDYKKKSLKKIFDKYIKVKPHIMKEVNDFINKNFFTKKIVGIHFRGTDQKISSGHSHPPTLYQITSIIDSMLNKNKDINFFLLTEDLKYYQILKKKYGNLICSFNFFRSNFTLDFSNSKRKNHRNKLGLENLIEAIALSRCNEIIYCQTNISLFSIFLSNFKIKKIHINNGRKSYSNFISLFQWYIVWEIPHKIKLFLKNYF
jgi:hypothetical protein